MVEVSKQQSRDHRRARALEAYLKVLSLITIQCIMVRQAYIGILNHPCRSRQAYIGILHHPFNVGQGKLTLEYSTTHVGQGKLTLEYSTTHLM